MPSYKIPLTRPFITDALKDRVLAVLDSGHLTEGPVTSEFEEAVRQFVGCEHAIAVKSCTAGLEVALRALGVGPGDEVIVPDFTYPATAQAALLLGATVVLVDVDRQNMVIDFDALEAALTNRTKAVIPVSSFGNPLDYGRLTALKNKHGFFVVEDAAAALGASFKNVRVGNQADISVFSFHPRKFITTGEGGVITTNNSDWAAWMRSFKFFGMSLEDNGLSPEFTLAGSNNKMSDILAAVGLAQMEEAEALLTHRIGLADHYIELLQDVSEVEVAPTTEGGVHSRQSFCVFVDNRDEILRTMREAGIEVQVGTYALHKHPAFSGSATVRNSGDLSNSRHLDGHCLALPLYHNLSSEDQATVVAELTKAL